MLNEKALEAARAARDVVYPLDGLPHAITAYLAALPSSPVSELVDATMDRIVQECVAEKLFLGTVNARAVIRKHLSASLTALAAENARLRGALSDLMSWFPDKPSEPEWRLTAGVYGADGAVNAARHALSTEPQGGEHVEG